jgi:oligosaccharide repeat unit polymerase
MQLAIFNALLYLFALGIYYRKYKKILDAGFILIATYAVIAVTGVFNYLNSPNEWSLIFWPFVYLFVICMLAFRPYFKYPSGSIADKFKINKPKFLNLFSWVYIVAAIIDFSYSIDSITTTLTSGNWSELYHANASGEVLLYTSQLERLAKNLTGWLSPLAIITFFYYLTFGKSNKFFLILFALAIVLPRFSIAILIAARGLLFIFVVNLFLGYLFFAKKISKNIRKRLLIFALIFVVIFLVYALAVTNSRFETANAYWDTKTSLLQYFGQSMLVFNDGIADSIQHFLNGDYLFNAHEHRYFNGYDYILGTHFGTSFFTFVGAWYLDFGPIGTFLIALFLPGMFSLYYNKRKIWDIADLFIYFFYLSWLLNGVFVIGTGYYLQWIMTLVIFLILKIVKV